MSSLVIKTPILSLSLFFLFSIPLFAHRGHDAAKGRGAHKAPSWKILYYEFGIAGGYNLSITGDEVHPRGGVARIYGRSSLAGLLVPFKKGNPKKDKWLQTIWLNSIVFGISFTGTYIHANESHLNDSAGNRVNINSFTQIYSFYVDMGLSGISGERWKFTALFSPGYYIGLSRKEFKNPQGSFIDRPSSRNFYIGLSLEAAYLAKKNLSISLLIRYSFYNERELGDVLHSISPEFGISYAF